MANTKKTVKDLVDDLKAVLSVAETTIIALEKKGNPVPYELLVIKQGTRKTILRTSTMLKTTSEDIAVDYGGVGKVVKKAGEGLTKKDGKKNKGKKVKAPKIGQVVKKANNAPSSTATIKPEPKTGTALDKVYEQIQNKNAKEIDEATNHVTLKMWAKLVNDQKDAEPIKLNLSSEEIAQAIIDYFEVKVAANNLSETLDLIAKAENLEALNALNISTENEELNTALEARKKELLTAGGKDKAPTR